MIKISACVGCRRPFGKLESDVRFLTTWGVYPEFTPWFLGSYLSHLTLCQKTETASVAFRGRKWDYCQRKRCPGTIFKAAKDATFCFCFCLCSHDSHAQNKDQKPNLSLTANNLANQDIVAVVFVNVKHIHFHWTKVLC